MKKRFLSSAMAVCIICVVTMTSCSAAEISTADRNVTAEPLAADAVQTAAFSDIPADVWYAEAVGWYLDNGLMDGTSATAFSPDRGFQPVSAQKTQAKIPHRRAGFLYKFL